jgi:hypothetical protein
MYHIKYNKVNYTLDFETRHITLNRNKPAVSITIKFPKDYPLDSGLRTYPHIGHVVAFWEKEDNQIYVDSFYLYALIDPSIATKEELNSLRGIGRHILCKVLNEIYELYKNEIHLDTLVYLHASSLRGCIKSVKDDSYIAYSETEIKEYFKNKIPSLSLENIRNFIETNLPNVDEEEEEDELDEKMLRLEYLELLCRIMNSSGLISYYRVYGFETIPDKKNTILMTKMGAPLHKILDKCSEKKDKDKQTACLLM